mgnify:CR=1 FL=1
MVAGGGEATACEQSADGPSALLDVLAEELEGRAAERHALLSEHFGPAEVGLLASEQLHAQVQPESKRHLLDQLVQQDERERMLVVDQRPHVVMQKVLIPTFALHLMIHHLDRYL